MGRKVSSPGSYPIIAITNQLQDFFFSAALKNMIMLDLY